MQATAIRIVPIAIGHAASFHACLDVVAREKRYLVRTEAPSLERVEAFVRDNIAADLVQFVALDGTRVVGWADILPRGPDALAHCGQLGMGVLPALRGQGLGEQLLRASLAKAKVQGITRVELEARADNQRAMRLYKKVGFIEETVKRCALRFDGVYYDAVQMALLHV